jgi:NitT/TauT family transport system ATP-binding protein
MLSCARLKKRDKHIDLDGLCAYECTFAVSRGRQRLVRRTRALAGPPGLICMEEPFSALGVLTARTLQDLVLNPLASPEVMTNSILLVTHSIEEVVAMSDRLVAPNADHGQIGNRVDLGEVFDLDIDAEECFLPPS